MDEAQLDQYTYLLQAVKERVFQAQYQALQAVNKELIRLYWDIGRIIVEKQAQALWGERVIETLARDVRAAFPGVRGFSARNLRYMRSFYLAYRHDELLQTLSAEISWSHNILIMEQCAELQERLFYLKLAAQSTLSYRLLERKIKSGEYHRFLANQTNFAQTLDVQRAAHALQVVKDDYNLDFLGLADAHTERELEDALVANITTFLSEMGGYFTFVGRQFRVEVNHEEFFIDLLFYHRTLSCLVAVELKAGKFQPEYVGKMQFYLSALDETERLAHENPSIGIIVCREKDRTIVDYTLRDVHKPIGVASYNHYARLEELPETIRKYLPSPEDLAQRFTQESL